MTRSRATVYRTWSGAWVATCNGCHWFDYSPSWRFSLRRAIAHRRECCS